MAEMPYVDSLGRDSSASIWNGASVWDLASVTATLIYADDQYMTILHFKIVHRCSSRKDSGWLITPDYLVKMKNIKLEWTRMGCLRIIRTHILSMSWDRSPAPVPTDRTWRHLILPFLADRIPRKKNGWCFMGFDMFWPFRSWGVSIILIIFPANLMVYQSNECFLRSWFLRYPKVMIQSSNPFLTTVLLLELVPDMGWAG